MRLYALKGSGGIYLDVDVYVYVHLVRREADIVEPATLTTFSPTRRQWQWSAVRIPAEKSWTQVVSA